MGRVAERLEENAIYARYRLFEPVHLRVSAEVSEACLPRFQLLEVAKKYMLRRIYKNT